MSLVIDSDPIPLETDAHGVVRVGGTRVTLDSIVTSYRQGATAEEIAEQFPVLDLADVHATVGFYLRRCAETEAYLAEQRQQHETIRRENEARHSPDGVRERLLSRRASKP